MGSQRITSKLGSSDIFHDSINPVAPANPQNVAMSAKLTTLTGKIQERFDSLGVTYEGTSNGSAGLITSEAGRISTPKFLSEKCSLKKPNPRGARLINSMPRSWMMKRVCTITERDIMTRGRVFG